MSCKDCLNRRGFLAQSAFVAAAAALAVAEGCGDGQIGPKAQPTAPGDPLLPLGGGFQIKLSDFPALANTGTIVDIGHDRTLMRTGATTFLGLSRICTHQGCDVDIKVDHYECPCHGSQFAADGHVLRGPDVASAPIGPLRALKTTFDPTTNSVTVE